MVDYFNYINKEPEHSIQRVEDFCKQNDLNSKEMKEVHFLVLQLQKITKADFYEPGHEQPESFDFLTSFDFTHPTRKEEEVLQQVLISGLSENLCRVAPIFDSLGNEIVVKNSKTKVSYECQESTGKL